MHSKESLSSSTARLAAIPFAAAFLWTTLYVVEYWTPSPYWTTLYELSGRLVEVGDVDKGLFDPSDPRFTAFHTFIVVNALGSWLLAIALVLRPSRSEVWAARALKVAGASLVAAVILLIGVAGTEKLGFLSDYYARPPAEVAWHFIGNAPAYARLCVATSLRLGAGVLLGALVAIPFGIGISRSGLLRASMSPWLALLAPLPPLLLKPVLVLLLPSQPERGAWLHHLFISPDAPLVRLAGGAAGLLANTVGVKAQADFAPSAAQIKDEWILILLVAWCVFWPIVLGIHTATLASPTLERTVQVARLCGASRVRSIMSIHFPQLLLPIWASVWQGVVIAFIVLAGVGESGATQVVANVEVNESKEGLAHLIHETLTQGSKMTVAYPVTLFAMLYMACINVVLRVVAAATMPWTRPVFPWQRQWQPPEDPTADLDRFVDFKIAQIRGASEARPLSGERPFITIRDLRKTYDRVVLDIDSLEIAGGEQVSIIGESGDGKSTLARIAAGLEPPDHGKCRVDVLGEEVWRGARRCRDLRSMGVSFVFQDYALFPTRTVWENIVFPLRCHGVAASLFADPVARLVRLLGLKDHTWKYPSQLSGGQQQRVALARALVVPARLTILDEPLSAIDQPKRDELVDLLEEIRLRCVAAGVAMTLVTVSHDNREVLRSSTRIIHMSGGRIAQDGKPRDLYYRPRSARIARFIGHPNVYEGRVEHANGQRDLVLDKSHDRISGLVVPLTGSWRIPLRDQPAAEEGPVVAIMPKNWIKRFTGGEDNPPEARVLITGILDPNVDFCGTHVEAALSVREVGSRVWVALQESDPTETSQKPPSPSDETELELARIVIVPTEAAR